MRWRDLIYAFVLIGLLTGAHKLGEIEGREDGKRIAMLGIDAYVSGRIDAENARRATSSSDGTNPPH